MINGIINVYKEEGYTSFDVVAKLRGITKIRKIGHTGTLDPDATGVLPVCIGGATKLCDMLTDKTKEYEAVLRLGLVTDTQDASGTVLERYEVNITKEEFEQAIFSFIGKSKQIPPMYSALKVDGKKLCDMARAGIEVERKPRDIEITDIKILDMTKDSAKIRVACSKGTYIRTLCNDIGAKLNCGGIMESLVRTRSGAFEIKDAHRLDEIESLAKEGRLDEIVTTIDSMFDECPLKTVSKEDAKRVENGNQLTIPYMGDRIRVYLEDGEFAAIYDFSDKNSCYTPYKMFLTR
ncbi:MAG: tRNA pseudouridine(55) synthase TruB [Lachnospiraceae bacterium]|nr:tRNA pseudouridine(55) synthase TruB [Lachnospiraceae bacterium]